MLLQDEGHRPVEVFQELGGPLTDSSDKLLYLNNLTRSRLYLECLLLASTVFAKGCPRIFHDGSHSYYRCLLDLDDLRAIAALDDVSSLPYAHFKALLHNAGVEQSALPPPDDRDLKPNCFKTFIIHITCFLTTEGFHEMKIL